LCFFAFTYYKAVVELLSIQIYVIQTTQKAILQNIFSN
ncbi:MAG: hypothetical protein RIQ33_1584, partial [Bacteroidota bacterium]